MKEEKGKVRKGFYIGYLTSRKIENYMLSTISSVMHSTVKDSENRMGRMFKHNLMEDVFNVANESFMQETRLIENEYSVNLPTKFVYQGKPSPLFLPSTNINSHKAVALECFKASSSV